MSDPTDPKLAEALNPRLALNKRLSKEEQEAKALPDKIPQSTGSVSFLKKWSPEERAKQNADLAKLLTVR